MKSLSEIQADNAAVEKRIEAKRKAALRRLKRFIRGRAITWDSGAYLAIGRVVNAAIDAWDAKERCRG